MRNRLAGFLPDATSKRGLRHQAKIIRPASSPLVRSRLERKISARSARTRRSIRSSRGRLTERAVGDLCFCCGLVRNGNERVGCRDDSVKHTTSPLTAGTCGELSDRKCFKVSLPPPNKKMSGRCAAATSVCRLQHVHKLRAPGRCSCRQFPAFPLYEAHQAQRQEIQTQNIRPHIAMGYQLSFAWKASLTRTPPPICTSALGSQTALVRRAMGVANE